MTKVALLGASGNAGARILRELSDRGHRVTAIARDPEKIEVLQGVTAAKGDVKDASSLAELLSDQNGSSISFEDYAIALVDEREKPKHIRERFTVGY